MSRMIVLSVISTMTLADANPTQSFLHASYRAGEVESESIEISFEPRHATDPANGSLGSEALRLPGAPPPLSFGHSRFSTLFRARDVLDVRRYPARAVARLHRLERGGSRGSNPCTAQFVGPRYLLTAAHCLATLGTLVPYAGFELSLMYDNGTSPAEMAAVPVTAIWVLRPRDEDPAAAPDSACEDVGLVEIATPLGQRMGWLGLQASSPMNREEILYRFSYPHSRGSEALRNHAQDGLGNLPEQARVQLRRSIDQAIAQQEILEPDFSPSNLYFEYGMVDDAGIAFFALNHRYALPGVSGAALVDSNMRIHAISSRMAGGLSYSCRLSASQIGALHTIMTR